MISRVKLPQPGSGKARVGDITAGSGRADSSESFGLGNGSERSTPALSLHAGPPAMFAAVAPPPRRVRTPDVNLQRSLRRAGSERSLARPLSESRRLTLSRQLSHSEVEIIGGELSPVGNFEDNIALPHESQGALDLDCASVECSAKGASASTSLRSGDPSRSGPTSTISMGVVVDQVRPVAEVAVVSSGLPPRHPQASGAQGYAQGRPKVDAVPKPAGASASVSRGCVGAGGDEGATKARQHQPQQRQRRSASEPPRGKPASVRLPQLVSEVQRHLQALDAIPADGDPNRWIGETGQLELFAEEMRWLIGSAVTAQAGAARSGVAADGECDEAMLKQARKVREMYVLRGDKDLRWVRQQYKSLEKEYEHLKQMVDASSPELYQKQMAELRSLSEEMEAEQARQKRLVAENRIREKSLARVVGDNAEGDGNARAITKTERLEAELSVLKVRNQSLHKQVEEMKDALKRALEHREQIDLKAQHVSEKLGNEEYLARLAEQRDHVDHLRNEETELRQEICLLQEARQKAALDHERVIREKARELKEWKEQGSELEARRVRLEAEERHLRRQVQRAPQRRANSKVTTPSGPTPTGPRLDSSPQRASRVPSPLASVPVSPLEENMPFGEGTRTMTPSGFRLESARPEDGSNCLGAPVDRETEPQEEAREEVFERVNDTLYVTYDDEFNSDEDPDGDDWPGFDRMQPAAGFADREISKDSVWATLGGERHAPKVVAGGSVSSMGGVVVEPRIMALEELDMLGGTALPYNCPSLDSAEPLENERWSNSPDVVEEVEESIDEEEASAGVGVEHGFGNSFSRADPDRNSRCDPELACDENDAPPCEFDLPREGMVSTPLQSDCSHAPIAAPCGQDRQRCSENGSKPSAGALPSHPRAVSRNNSKDLHPRPKPASRQNSVDGLKPRRAGRAR